MKELEERGRLDVRVIELQGVHLPLQQKKGKRQKEQNNQVKKGGQQEKRRKTHWERAIYLIGTQAQDSYATEAATGSPEDGRSSSNKEQPRREGDANETRRAQDKNLEKRGELTRGEGDGEAYALEETEEGARTRIRTREELPDTVVSPERHRNTMPKRSSNIGKQGSREQKPGFRWKKEIRANKEDLNGRGKERERT